LFNRNQAIRAMVLAGRLALGCGDEDPFVIGCMRNSALLAVMPHPAASQ
jgi:hypothetical protein